MPSERAGGGGGGGSFGGGGEERGRDRGGEGDTWGRRTPPDGGSDTSSRGSTPAPAGRPRLKLAPRTKPLPVLDIPPGAFQDCYTTLGAFERFGTNGWGALHQAAACARHPPRRALRCLRLTELCAQYLLEPCAHCTLAPCLRMPPPGRRPSAQVRDGMGSMPPLLLGASVHAWRLGDVLLISSGGGVLSWQQVAHDACCDLALQRPRRRSPRRRRSRSRRRRRRGRPSRAPTRSARRAPGRRCSRSRGATGSRRRPRSSARRPRRAPTLGTLNVMRCPSMAASSAPAPFQALAIDASP